jgi:hypothetical protein
MISRQPSAFFKRFLAIDSTLRESADRPLGRQRHSVCRVGLRPSRRRWLRRHLYLGHRPCRRFSEAMPSDLSHHYRSEGIRAMSGFPARTAADIGPEYRRTSNGVQTFAPNCKVDHTRIECRNSNICTISEPATECFEQTKQIHLCRHLQMEVHSPENFWRLSCIHGFGPPRRQGSQRQRIRRRLR